MSASPDRASPRSAWTAGVLFVLLTALAGAGVETSHYATAVAQRVGDVSFVEASVVYLVLAAKSLWLVAPALVLFGLLAWRGWRRTGAVLLGIGWVVVAVPLALDLYLQRAVGSHLSDHVEFAWDAVRMAGSAEHGNWAGDTDSLVRSLLTVLAILGVAGAGLGLLSVLAGRRLGRAGAWGATLLLFGVAGGAVPAQLLVTERSVLQRLYALMPADLSLALDLADVLGGRRIEAPTVRIVSLRPNPRGKDQGKEFADLHNFTDEPVDLSGWLLHDEAGRRKDLEGTLDPSQTLRVALSEDDVVLDNGGDALWLVDSAGAVRHHVRYVERDAVGGTIINYRGEDDLDAFLVAFNEGIKPVYDEIHPRLEQAQPVDSEAHVEGEHLPDVVLVIVESMRAGTYSSDDMPRLQAWSEGGLRLEHHYSGSNITHFGLYSLFYGRVPIFYDQDLDADVHSQLTETLSRSGYETAFLTSGQFEGWRRMEEFLNEDNFDRVEAPSSGAWKQWGRWVETDRWLFRRAAELLEEQTDAPQLLVIFTTSNHYPYAFPDEFAVHQPSGGDAVEYDTWTRLDSEALRNRYKNSALFMEDLVLGFVSDLDMEHSVVMITGDHGESLGEDTVLSHGSRPSEVQLRVPFVMVGAGVPAHVVSEPTVHTDMLPTLLHALAGQHFEVEGLHGRDLLDGEIAEGHVLFNPRQWFQPYELVLVRGDRRLLLKVRLDRPELTAWGFLDESGEIILDTSKLPEEDPDEWVQAMAEELRRFR